MIKLLFILLVLSLGAFSQTPTPPELFCKIFSSGAPAPDTFRLTPQGMSIHLFAICSDTFGNVIGTINCTWTTTGNLHAPVVSQSGEEVFFDVASVPISQMESGYLIAQGLNTSPFRDSVYVIIDSKFLSITNRSSKTFSPQHGIATELYDLRGRIVRKREITENPHKSLENKRFSNSNTTLWTIAK